METHAFTKHHESTSLPVQGFMDKRKRGDINEYPDAF